MSMKGFLKFFFIKTIESLYEKQGILEDGDTDHRDGADGTGNYAGRERLQLVEAYPQPLPERRGAWRGERERSEPPMVRSSCI